MDILVIIGLVLTFVVLSFAVPDIFVHPAVYIQKEAFVMVFGGVLTLFIIASSWEDIKGVLKGIQILFRPNRFPDEVEIVDKLVQLSILSQKEGRGALEEAGRDFDDGFLDNGLLMIVNKLQPEFIRVVLENEMQEIETRHQRNIQGIKFMSTIAPLTGMFGTIIGIVQVLQNMRDPKTVGPAMALALLTTMYGVFISGFLLQPIANRLSKNSEAEIMKKNIMVEGLIMIAKGEIPIKVETYLRGFLSNQKKKTQLQAKQKDA